MGLTRLVIDYKDSVKAATTTNVTLSGGAPNTLDGVSLALRDRILVKNQNNAAENGIYNVTTLGTGSNGTWSRTTDFDDWRKITPGSLLFVDQGTANGNVFYYIKGGLGNVTVGTTSINFANLSATFATGGSVIYNGPGGSNTQVQFNDAGNLGGSSLLVFNKTTGNLTVGGSLITTNGLFWANGTAFSSGSNYGNTEVSALLRTYTGNLSSGNFTNTGALRTGDDAANVIIANASVSSGSTAQRALNLIGTNAVLKVARTNNDASDASVEIQKWYANGTLANYTEFVTANSSFSIRDRTTSILNRLLIDSSGNIGISNTSPVHRLAVSGNVGINGNIFSSSFVYDSKGDVRAVPQNSQTGAYVLVATDAGRHISITTGGITVPNAVFQSGDAITVFNNSSSNQTITQGGAVTMYLAGTATTGNRTLAQRGLATILCYAANSFVISGAGLT